MSILRLLRKHFIVKYANCAHAYNAGKLSDEQLKTFITCDRPVLETIKLYEKKLQHEQNQKELMKLKSKKLADEYLKHANDKMTYLKYDYAEVKKHKPKTPATIKSQATRLENITTDINYCLDEIKTLEDLKKRQARKPGRPKKSDKQKENNNETSI